MKGCRRDRLDPIFPTVLLLMYFFFWQHKRLFHMLIKPIVIIEVYIVFCVSREAFQSEETTNSSSLKQIFNRKLNDQTSGNLN